LTPSGVLFYARVEFYKRTKEKGETVTFEPGREKTGGRKPGVENKVTREQKKILLEFFEFCNEPDAIKKFRESWKEGIEKDALSFFEKIVIPILKLVPKNALADLVGELIGERRDADRELGDQVARIGEQIEELRKKGVPREEIEESLGGRDARQESER